MIKERMVKDILIFRIRNNKETAPCLQEFFYIYIYKKEKKKIIRPGLSDHVSMLRFFGDRE